MIKKTFLMLAAGAIMCTASAAETSPLRGEVKLPAAPLQMKTMDLSAYKLDNLKPGQRRAKSLRKADGLPSLEGEWNMMFLDIYFGDDSLMDGVKVVYSATLDGTTLTFKPAEDGYQEMVAEYDEEEGTVTFGRVYLGVEDGYHLYQQPFIYNYDAVGNQNPLEYQDITGYLATTQNVIVFEDAPGIAWNYYTDEAGTKFQGPINMLDLTVFYQPVGGEWKEVGTAEFIDGWLIPAYGEDQFEYLYGVTLQQNAANENLYRLVNPYKSGPLSGQNFCRTNGYIVFDVSDPDHVIFLLSDAGFTNYQAGITTFFAYNWFGVLCLINPNYTPDELIEALGDQIIYTTFKDGVVSLGTNFRGVPDARFGVQYDPIYGMYWALDDAGTPANMTTKIIFPGAGVGSIEAENSDKPVEYFNLQGVRVANPEAGQLVIKRQGTKVEKIIK